MLKGCFFWADSCLGSGKAWRHLRLSFGWGRDVELRCLLHPGLHSICDMAWHRFFEDLTPVGLRLQVSGIPRGRRTEPGFVDQSLCKSVVGSSVHVCACIAPMGFLLSLTHSLSLSLCLCLLCATIAQTCKGESSEHADASSDMSQEIYSARPGTSERTHMIHMHHNYT